MASIKKTIDSRSDFQQGTLTDVVATNEGSLELAFVSTKLDKVESTSADFNAGVLDKLIVTSLGDVQLGPGGTDVTHNANFLEGTLSGAILAAGDVSLPKGADIAYTESFNGVFTDAELIDGHVQLQTSGVNAAYNETNKEEFETGTLSNVVATLSGDLELARASEASETFTSNADFNTGILVNAVVADGNVSAIHTNSVFEYNDPSPAQTLARTEHALSHTEILSAGVLTDVVQANGEVKLAKELSVFTHAEDFKVGTHVDTVATDELALDGGDLELSFQTLTEVVEDSTQAQFNAGDLVGVTGTPEGDLSLAVSSFEVNDTYDTADEWNTFTNSYVSPISGTSLTLRDQKVRIDATHTSGVAAGYGLASANPYPITATRIRCNQGVIYEMPRYSGSEWLATTIKIGSTSYTLGATYTIHGYDIYSSTKEIYTLSTTNSGSFATQVRIWKKPASGTVLEMVRTFTLSMPETGTRIQNTPMIAVDDVRGEMWVHGDLYNATPNNFLRRVIYVYDLNGVFLRYIPFDALPNSRVFTVNDGLMFSYNMYDSNGQLLNQLGLQWTSTTPNVFSTDFASIYMDDVTGQPVIWVYGVRSDGKDLSNNNLYEYKQLFHTLSTSQVVNNNLTGYATKYFSVNEFSHIVDSAISWTQSVGSGSISIDTSFNGGITWSGQSNGMPISGLPTGTDLTGKTMGIRVTFIRPDKFTYVTISNLNIFLRSTEPSLSIAHTEDFSTGVVSNTVATTDNVKLSLTTGSPVNHTEDINTGTKTNVQINGATVQLSVVQTVDNPLVIADSYTMYNVDMRGRKVVGRNLYYMQRISKTLVRMNLDTKQETNLWTTVGNYPVGIVIDEANDKAYISFSYLGIRIVTLSTGVETADVRTTTYTNGDITTDGTYLYILDAATRKMYRYGKDGSNQGFTQFPTIAGVTFDNAGLDWYGGHFYITSTTNGDVYKMTPAGAHVETIKIGNTKDGAGTTRGLAFDGQSFYVQTPTAGVAQTVRYDYVSEGYAPTGTYVSTPVAIGSAIQAASSSISWTQTTPANTNLIMEASLDNGATWTAVTSGGPFVPTQTNLTGKNVQVRATLSNTDNATTPTFSNLSFAITPASLYAATGTYISDPIPMGEMEEVTTSTVNWTEIVPANTSMTMERSLDNGATWSPLTNGGEVVPTQTSIIGQTITFRATLTSTDSAVTPQLTAVDFTFQSDPRINPSGSRIRYIDLVDVNSATLSFNATTPAGTTLTMETSIDGGTWTALNSGDAIPGLTDNTYGQLAVRQTLETTEAYISPLLHDLTVTMSKTQFLASGSHTSNVIAIPTHLVTDARINWTQTTPAGTTVEIQTSTNGGSTFETVANGGMIPGFTVNANAPSTLLIKQILYTSDTETTPSLHDLSITVNEYFYKSSGVRLAVAKDLSAIKILENTTLNVATTLPAGTNIVVDVSIDNVNWMPRTSSLGLASGADLTGVLMYVRETLTTTNPYVTPTLRSVSYTLDGYSYETAKTHVAPNFLLQNEGVLDEGVVTWTEDKPAGTNVSVSLVLPNGTKVAVTNGQPVAELVGLLAESAIMHFEAVLSTSNIAVAPSFSALNFVGSGKRYDRTATHTTQAKLIDIASVASSEMVWNATGVVAVHTSLDNGATWQVATNGSAIPGITKGANLGGISILVRTTITGAITSTPMLHDISWSVSGGYLTSGSRSIAPINLSTVGIARSSTFTLNKTEPIGTSAKVEIRISTNGGVTYGAWVEPVNGQSIPGIVSGMNLANVFIEMRQALLSTDVMVTPSLHNIGFTIDSGFKTAGSYESAVLSIGAAELVATSLVNFAKTTPTGTGILVESRLSSDNGATFGAWQVVNTAQAIPSIAAGVDAAGKAIQLRYSLATTDVAVTPSLHSLNFTINAGYKTGGTYRTIVIDKTAVGIAASSQLSWMASTPLSTSVKVETSVDNGATWQIATNGEAIPSINNGNSIQARATLLTTDLTKTPSLDSLWFTISSGFATKGIRTSFAYAFPGIGKVSTSRIRWTASTPVGTSVFIETSIDNGFTWQIATNGYIIPGITGGMQMENTTVMVRQTLNTNQTGSTPVLHDLTLTVEGGGYEQIGQRISAPIALDAVGTISGNEITWISTEPFGTKVEVYAAISPSSVQVPSNESFLPLIITSRIEMGIDRYETTGRVEQMVDDTEMSGLYLWVKEILSTEDVN